MENMVTMSLRDYNAMKRKADLMEYAMSIQTWGDLVEVHVDLSYFADMIDMKIQEAPQRATTWPTGELIMRPLEQFNCSACVGEYYQPEELTDPTE